MNKFNPFIHHRRSIHLKGYDYSQAGLYFITLCVKNRECLFGEIFDGEMIWNDAGEMANQCWLEIPQHFPNVVLHAHIVMPNHVHGVIEIADSPIERSGNIPDIITADDTVGAKNFSPQIIGTENIRAEDVPPQRYRGTVGSIVKGFKIGVTKWFRQTYPNDFLGNRLV